MRLSLSVVNQSKVSHVMRHFGTRDTLDTRITVMGLITVIKCYSEYFLWPVLQSATLKDDQKFKWSQDKKGPSTTTNVVYF